DRLFQMELLRRTVRGELAAVLGKDLIEEDKRRRTYGFAHLADAAASQQAPDYAAALAAYADGVNAWAEGHKDALPPEFAKLKNVLPGHIVVSTNDLERLDRLFGRLPENEERLGQPSAMDEAREASNDWVVSGSKTATGKPMLANDPHLAATAPSIWYIITL